MNEFDVEDFARRVAGAMETFERPPLLSRIHPGADLETAYRVQQALIKRLTGHAPIAGFKAGLTAPAAQALYAADRPVSGVLLASDIDAAARRLRPLGVGALRLETEVAYRTAVAIGAPVGRSDLVDCIDACLPAVEVVQDWLAGEHPTARDLVAVNVNARGFLLGDPLPLDRDALNGCKVELHRGGERLHGAPAGSVLGDQFEALRWLIDRTVAQGYEIAAGAVLLTGAIGGIQPGLPGTYRAVYDGVDRLEFVVADD